MTRALIVGIDHYPDQPLADWVANAEAMAGLLKRNADGSPNWTVSLITSITGRYW